MSIVGDLFSEENILVGEIVLYDEGSDVCSEFIDKMCDNINLWI